MPPCTSRLPDLSSACTARSARSRCRRGARSLALGLALGLLGAPAASALPLDLVLDASRSRLESGGAPAAPLSGRLRLDLGALPPLLDPAPLAVEELELLGEGLRVTLNPDLASPGLGVLRPDGTFLVPALFVRVDLGSGPIDQTLVDVEGTLRADASCAPLGSPCLETSLAVDTLGPEGVVDVEVVAAVPEPRLVWMLLPALVLGWASRRSRSRRPAAGAMPGRRRASVAAVALCGGVGLGASPCTPRVDVEQIPADLPGFVEPHTPGSGAPEELATPETVRQILGPAPDLNRVSFVRTRLAGVEAEPRVVLILIPGFLGSAGTFDPVARDLVRAMGGNLEVWAVDRRSNQLEDRRGAFHARAGAEAAVAAGDDAALQTALAEGIRFYFPDSDIDEDGSADGPFVLPDQVPADGPSGWQRLSQDDMRFAAFWGVDTFVRDWRELVLEARRVVGPEGLVLFGGHSMGTTWTGVFAAYDFDPGPGVQAGWELVDGLLLLEGGGPNAPSPDAPDASTYRGAIEDLAAGTQEVLVDLDPQAQGCQNPLGCSNDVFLADLFGLVDAVALGAAGELNGVAGAFDPQGPSLVQRTPLFGASAISLLLQAPMTNRSLVGFFLDDDFSTNAAFAASMGFSDDGSNVFNPIPFLVPGSFLVAASGEGIRRTWKAFDDPTLPTCPPNDPAPAFGEMEVGCAILDNGPRPGPGEPPAVWGLEREVTDADVLLRTLFETSNASEWYFTSGRPSLDLAFGRDSSALGEPQLLNVTQNASVDVPVLGIGGSNGLTPTESSFGDYFGSIASTDTRAVIVEGYAHLDVLSATDNEAVPPILDWIQVLLQRRLLEGGAGGAPR